MSGDPPTEPERQPLEAQPRGPQGDGLCRVCHAGRTAWSEKARANCSECWGRSSRCRSLPSSLVPLRAGPMNETCLGTRWHPKLDRRVEVVGEPAGSFRDHRRDRGAAT